MAFFTPKEDLLVDALTRKDGQLQIGNCISSINTIFKNALRKEPRLLAFLSKYEYSYTTGGLSKDYVITFTYQDDCPASLSDVVLDNGSWDAATVIAKSGPKEMTIVTDDETQIQSKLTDQLNYMISAYEGLLGWASNTQSFSSISDKSVVKITYNYMMPVPQLRQLQNKATFAAKNIWRNILGKSKVPKFAKPFLALSYLTQECCYDQRAFDELADNPGDAPSDPIPHLSYGPLVEGRGICSGMAWAFKKLMDEAGIECICVSGLLKEDTSQGHMWNMVCLDNQYYHVDPTWGIKDSGVHIDALMQPDNIMHTSHIWDTSRYPKARGTRFDYDYVEEFLADNGNDFLDDGANEKYFFPDEIID